MEIPRGFPYRPLAVGVAKSLFAHAPPFWCTVDVDAQCTRGVMASSSSSSSKKKSLLRGGYFSSLQDEAAKKRYCEKLRLSEGLDPYETEKKDWEDNVDLWPSVTHINVGMFLLLTPSAYSGNDLLNYKSMESYRNFLAGWVREVLVRSLTNADGSKKVIVIAKVREPW